MCFLYSSCVVAPIHRSSPRASIGLRMLAASMEPSVFPAPRTLWISSMKRIRPGSGAVATSFRTAVSRSSNSPRCLAPAISRAMSRVRRPIPCIFSGTSFARIRWARPSTTAVLPTPGSPTSTGLFFVRRESIWITRRISSSRPMTGSSLPDSARSTRSIPYCSRASKVDSAVFESIFLPLRIASVASVALFLVRPESESTRATFESVYKATRRLSSETRVSPLLSIVLLASAITRLKDESGADCSGGGD
mmetsp:Transcript_36200/g.67280  ORF Transcript_36200/g.67280 Transcript_36200/m.67280 type:complete len:250 (-) Transcript_36200:386-1135(-)